MKELTEGRHMLSGVGDTTIENYRGYEDTEVTLFCIDGETWGMYIDPDDGYRSYSSVLLYPEERCQTMFEPQPVDISFNHTEFSEYDGGTMYIRDIMTIKDAINGKVIVEIGTDSYDSYYPTGFFHYYPENMEVNKNSNHS